MIRRDFLRQTASSAVTLPSLINGLPFLINKNSPWTRALSNFAIDTDHVLVLVRLDGGNDGLNTVVPLDQYDVLANVREEVILPENNILRLRGNDKVGLHPAMRGMRDLYNDGKLEIIQSVGYPNPDYSHFRSTDIWMTASDSEQVLNTGWMGRYLNFEYPNYPQNFPNAEMPDPVSIEIGGTLSLTFQGPTTGMGMSIYDPDDFYRLVQGVQATAPNTPAGEQLKYVRLIARQTNSYGQVIKDAYERGNNLANYPPAGENNLADQIKIVARLISGGLKTRVYMVSIGGFDTHDSQVDADDHLAGEHADLLRMVSEAVTAFVKDVELLQQEDRVLGMTFSEFGRRIISNFSLGTDHGAAAPMFLFGKPVKSGILGDNPLIPADANAEDNLPMQYDFRSVYASILKDWFCVPEADLDGIMLQNFQRLELLNVIDCLPSATRDKNQAAGKSLVSCYPNPFTQGTNISYETGGGHTMIQIFNMAGQLVDTPVSKMHQPGQHQIWWDSEELPAGSYYVRLQNGMFQQVKTVVKVR